MRHTPDSQFSSRLLLERHRGTTVLAYLDDVFIVGHADQTVAALVDLISALTQTGLRDLSPIVWVVCPFRLGHEPLPIEVKQLGTEILGMPVGCLNCLMSMHIRSIPLHKILCSTSRALSCSKTKLCNSFSLTAASRQAAQIHKYTVTYLASRTVIADKEQISVPITSGGLGMVLAEESSSPAAIFASWVHSIKKTSASLRTYPAISWGTNWWQRLSIPYTKTIPICLPTNPTLVWYTSCPIH